VVSGGERSSWSSSLPKFSGKSVAATRGMLTPGMGLGELARDLSIDPAELDRAVAAVMSQGRSQEGPESGRGLARGRP